MILGHYAVALAAKRVTPSLSLGTLFLSAQLLDELWPIMLLLGVERVRIVPGLMAANPLDFVHYPWTHSLLMAVVWGVLLGTIYFIARRWRAGALMVGALVVSHWFLDVPMHRPDLPLWPGSEVMVGFGAWRSVTLTLTIELALWSAGISLYVAATRARDRIGRWALWGFIALAAVIYVAGVLGPPPTSERGVAIGALGLWLFVPWGYWIDRHREMEVAGR